MQLAYNIKVIIGFVVIAQTIVAIIQAIVLTVYGKKTLETEIKTTKMIQEKQKKLIVDHANLINDLNEKLDKYWYHSFNRHYHFSKLSPYGAIPPPYSTNMEQRSLFVYRMYHFSEEKHIIAEEFVALIKEKLKESGMRSIKKVFLLLDSGSTVYHVFEVLCNAYYLANEEEKALLRKLFIITNNVSGANRLSEIGRVGGSIQADMLFECYLLPGLAEGKYNAVLSKETSEYIQEIIGKYSLGEDIYIFGAVTGNYFSCPEGILTRGTHHDSVKSAIINISNHVSILTPLGKLSSYKCSEINDGIQENLPPLIRPKKYKIIPRTSIESFLVDKEYKDKVIRLFTTHNRNYDKEGGNLTKVTFYFNRIIQDIERIIRNTNNRNDFNINKVKFDPSLQSEQVISDPNQDKFEAIFNYEFPHPAMRYWMRKEILDNSMS